MHLFDTGIKHCNNVELHYISLINVIKQYLMIHTRYRHTNSFVTAETFRLQWCIHSYDVHTVNIIN